jgi:hypothetical protein
MPVPTPQLSWEASGVVCHIPPLKVAKIFYPENYTLVALWIYVSNHFAANREPLGARKWRHTWCRTTFDGWYHV